MMKKKKPLILAAVFIVIVIVLNNLLNFMLIQPGLARTVLRESSQGGYDTIIVGASHGTYGIDSEELSLQLGGSTMNMCMGGEYMYDAYYVLKYALKNNKPSTVILDVDYQYLVNQHDESILFNAIYNAYPNCLEKFEYFSIKMTKEEFRGALLPWTNYWQCYKYIGTTIQKKMSEEYKNADPSLVSMNKFDTYMGNGFISRSSDYKKVNTSCLEWEESKVDDNQCKYMKKIVDLCKKNNINVVFTTVVQDPVTVAQQKDKFQAAHDYIQKLAEQYSVTYLDFNMLKFSVFDRETGDFYDREGHMYGNTANRFTKLYGAVVKEALAGTLDTSAYFGTSYQNVYQGQSNQY